MKKYAVNVQHVTVVAALIAASHSFNSRANDLFLLIWRGSYQTTDSSGRVVSHAYTERSVVDVIAQNNALNPRDLVLVYRPTSYDLAVVFKSNGQVVSDYLQLPDITRTNTNWITEITDGTHIVRQAFIFDENHANPLGSMYGVETRTHNSDGSIRNASFHGRFDFALQDSSGIFPAGIYHGSFFTGRRIVDSSSP